MRRMLLLASASAIAVAGLPGLLAAASAQTGDQAHGIGTLESWAHCPGGSIATFDFSAASGPSGEDATGVFSFVCSPVGSIAQQTFGGVVTCLAVTGSEAVIGGVVTASTSGAFPIGEELSFTVLDGGPGGLGDAFSDLLQGSNCRRDFPRHPLVTGEIVVVDAVAPPPAEPAAVVLTPPTAINQVGSTHTVAASAATAAGAPAAGFTILFDVSGSVEEAGACTTDAQGQCTFTYNGPLFPGADIIVGCADADQSGAIEAGEPCGEATKIWMLPTTTPGQVTGGGWLFQAADKVSFGFNARSTDVGEAATGMCNVIDHATRTHVKCLTVDALVVTPTHATFFGQATADGVPTAYRIDVDDLDEANLADTFAIETTSGYSAAGIVEGGNIKIHP